MIIDMIWYDNDINGLVIMVTITVWNKNGEKVNDCMQY